jgi:hypothetical protein
MKILLQVKWFIKRCVVRLSAMGSYNGTGVGFSIAGERGLADVNVAACGRATHFSASKLGVYAIADCMGTAAR